MNNRFWPGLAALGVAAAALAAPASATDYHGTFALQGGTPRIVMHLATTPGKTAEDATLDLWATTTASSSPLASFETVHTKKMHLIAVSDDLGVFLHEHPTLLSNGHFTLTLHVPRAALYHIFADVTPHGLSQQVVRFDVPFGSGARTPVMVTVPKRTVDAGPYAVTLSTLRLGAGDMAMLSADVEKNGKPATDLHPYLGAAAHAVFIHYADWTYVHVHPIATSGGNERNGMGSTEASLSPGAKVSPSMMLHVMVTEPGNYKLWLEFRGGADLYRAPFVLTAS